MSRRSLALGPPLAFLLLLACTRADTDRAATPGPRLEPTAAEPRPAERPVETAHAGARRVVSDEPAGHLEHPTRLGSFFSLLSELEARRAPRDVRVVQLGDSHTACDYHTSVARARLGERFGDGGRGLLGLGEPHKRQFQAGESMARSLGFRPVEAALMGVAGRARPDGFFGLTGVAMDAREPGASTQSDLTASADHLEIAYLTQPGGGSFDVLVDGRPRARVTTRGASRASAFHAIDVTRGPHRLDVKLLGDGPVRLFGVRLDDDAIGVTWDALGMNGAKAPALLASDRAHFAEQLAHVAPGLVVLAYGTNEVGDLTTTPAEHASALAALQELVSEGAGGAACLVLGPPDRGATTMPKLAEIVAAQRRAADDAGCAFYDQLAAMGGPGTIGRWARESPPRARRDFVHLNRAGYAELAEGLVRDLLSAYDRWRGEIAVAAQER